MEKFSNRFSQALGVANNIWHAHEKLMLYMKLLAKIDIFSFINNWDLRVHTDK